MREHLHDYYITLTPQERTQLAILAGTTPLYLHRLAYYPDKRIAPDLALRLEMASDGQLHAEELCPDFNWAAAANRRRCQCDNTTTEET